MIPSAWEFALMALAAYRLTRLAGWDEFPLAVRIRSLVTAEKDDGYGRPILAHLIHCPFCIGWWISLAVFLSWLALDDWALAVLAPLAISGAVGLIAKNLDE